MAKKPARSELRDSRTYFVSDERLRAFGQLSYAQRLQWVEECSRFVRMAQAAKKISLIWGNRWSESDWHLKGFG
ncbi:MAG: hypothetical protein IPH35_05175 [Rhodoferax sp.]|nr:hypothetical protein [Rhodoferax sp.]